MSNVQIDKNLFFDVVKIICLGIDDPQLTASVKAQLEDKLQRIAAHDAWEKP